MTGKVLPSYRENILEGVMKQIIIALGVIAALMSSSSAFAAKDKFLAFNLGLIYSQSAAESASGDTTIATSGLNGHAGVFIFHGLIVGLRYYSVTTNTSTTEELTTTTTATVTSTQVTSGYGLHVGYYAESGFTVGGAYLFSPEYKTTDVLYDGGSGIVFDAGWRWEIGDFGFGAQLTYSQMIYSDFKIAGVEGEFTENEKFTSLTPMGFAAIFF